MKEHPILFSSPMIRAILAGTKTQTRRIVNPQPTLGEHGWSWPSGRCKSMVSIPEMGCLGPYGSRGNRLWVREAFYCDDYRYPDGPRSELIAAIEYRADHECCNWEAGCPCSDDNGRSSWRPSIYMPRWASRITLEVTDVRVQRLQDISEDDARTEGVDEIKAKVPTALDAFHLVWDEINGKRAPWSSNPWVWAISFRRLP